MCGPALCGSGTRERMCAPGCWRVAERRRSLINQNSNCFVISSYLHLVYLAESRRRFGRVLLLVRNFDGCGILLAQRLVLAQVFPVPFWRSARLALLGVLFLLVAIFVELSSVSLDSLGLGGKEAIKVSCGAAGAVTSKVMLAVLFASLPLSCSEQVESSASSNSLLSCSACPPSRS